MGPRHDLSFCACSTACLASELLVSMGPRPHLWILMQNSVFWYRIISLYGSQTSPVALYTQIIVSGTRITSLCGSQTSPAVFCMQNSVRSIRITSLYGPQPSPVVFGCITVTFGPEQHVSMGPRHHLSFCACKTS